MQGRNVHRNGRAVFLLSAEGFISAVSTQRAARGKMGPGDLLFTTRAELMRVTAEWSIGRLVRAWNNIPQTVLLKRFANRQKAVERIWDALQTLKPVPFRRTDAVPAENGAIKIDAVIEARAISTS